MINLPCDLDRICAVARRYNLLVIEDACQAAGVTYSGRPLGSVGDAAAFSFNAFKNVNIGEGGAFVTNDPRLFVRARNYHDLGAPIRGHGDTRNEPPFVGGNMRVTELQGAMLAVQLEKLAPMMERVRARREIMAEILRARGFRLAPHHDEANAARLVVLFDAPEQAIAFCERPGVTRLLDNSKHVYTNWDAIISKRTFHPAMNPWSWAHREIDYTPQTCARSLEILGRACRVAVGQRFPALLMRLAAHRITRPV
jgi:dTDP-4-amino-4,6-dideoxygalactose transaminase